MNKMYQIFILSAMLKVMLFFMYTDAIQLQYLKQEIILQEKAFKSNLECFRECRRGDVRQCKYKMMLNEHTTMSTHCGGCPYNVSDCSKFGCVPAGGIIRQIVTANMMLPGPSIQVCEGDTIVVDIINAMQTKSTTIHWHGIHQVGTPYMDGAPYVTQCPILPFNNFRYEFKASPHGTHMWHGHSGFQESDGLYGSLIVRREEPAEIRYLYDYDLLEHIVMAWHWYGQPSADVLVPALHRNESVSGYSLLINGKAALKQFVPEQIGESSFTTPREVFRLKKGKRYRFRIIANTAIYCPLQVSIDNHKMLALASDTSTFEPVEVDSLILNAGERFDVVVNASEPETCYWMRFRGLGDCGETKTSVHQEALVCYGNHTQPPANIPNYDEGNRAGVLLNPVELATQPYPANTLVHLTDLNATDDDSHNTTGPAHKIFYIQLNSRPYDFLSYPGPWHQMNNITFEFPGRSMLTQRHQLTASDFCSHVSQAVNCIGDFCSCPYTQQLPLGQLIEIVLVDISVERNQDHPIHLHGYNFKVVAMGVLGDNVSVDLVRKLNENGLLKKKLEKATMKDTISVPNRGYAIIHFYTDNPGYWLFHCHVSNHMEMGMAMVLQVGSNYQMAETPSNFPTCGNWINNGDSSRAAVTLSHSNAITPICIIITALFMVQTQLLGL